MPYSARSKAEHCTQCVASERVPSAVLARSEQGGWAGTAGLERSPRIAMPYSAWQPEAVERGSFFVIETYYIDYADYIETDYIETEIDPETYYIETADYIETDYIETEIDPETYYIETSPEHEIETCNIETNSREFDYYICYYSFRFLFLPERSSCIACAANGISIRQAGYS